MESGNSIHENVIDKDIKSLAYLLYDIFVEQERLHDDKLRGEDSCNEDSSNE